MSEMGLHTSAPQPNPHASAQTPRVFDFKDYREFLSTWLKWKKQTSPHYSGALFAKKAGLSSHTLLGMVIRGERNLSYTTIRGFSKALGLRGRELTYFEKLVLFNQAQKSEDKAYHFEQLFSLSQGRGREILTQIQDYASFIGHWYVVAIHELVHHPEFRPDPEWIVRQFKRKITKKQAEAALDTLLRLKLIGQDSESGAYRVVHPSIDIDPGTIDFAIRNFHKEYLERAKDAVDSDALEERELSSLTFCIPVADLPALRARIKDFRKQLNLDFPASSGPRTCVVAINTQAIVLTAKENSNEGEERK